jgi:hypothetical protein
MSNELAPTELKRQSSQPAGHAGEEKTATLLDDLVQNLLSMKVSCACGKDADELHKVEVLSELAQQQEYMEAEDSVGEREYNRHTEAYRAAWQAEFDAKIPDPDNTPKEAIHEVVYGHMIKWAQTQHPVLCCIQRHSNPLLAISV